MLQSLRRLNATVGWRSNSIFNKQQRCFVSLKERASIIFAIQDKPGALEEVLSALTPLNVSLTAIESRPSKTPGFYDIYVDFSAEPNIVKKAFSTIGTLSQSIRVESSGEDDSGVGKTPWFPRKISDLDSFASKVLSYGAVIQF